MMSCIKQTPGGQTAGRGVFFDIVHDMSIYLKCDIITCPPSIIEKIEKFGKTFTDLTVDTVRGFLKDSKRSKFQI